SSCYIHFPSPNSPFHCRRIRAFIAKIGLFAKSTIHRQIGHFIGAAYALSLQKGVFWRNLLAIAKLAISLAPHTRFHCKKGSFGEIYLPSSNWPFHWRRICAFIAKRGLLAKYNCDRQI